jgi:hypothetical protein
MSKRKDDDLAKLFKDFKETAEPIDPEGEAEALRRFRETIEQKDAKTLLEKPRGNDGEKSR